MSESKILEEEKIVTKEKEEYEEIEEKNIFQIEIVEAKNLKERLLFGNIKPYVNIHIGSFKKSSKVDHYNSNPKFYQKFNFDSTKIKNQKIVIKVYDLIGNTGMTKKRLG
jgi:Ca2+-dependent lipid-binding protein